VAAVQDTGWLHAKKGTCARLKVRFPLGIGATQDTAARKKKSCPSAEAKRRSIKPVKVKLNVFCIPWVKAADEVTLQSFYFRA
jgi:hypothetical protein